MNIDHNRVSHNLLHPQWEQLYVPSQQWQEWINCLLLTIIIIQRSKHLRRSQAGAQHARVYGKPNAQ